MDESNRPDRERPELGDPDLDAARPVDVVGVGNGLYVQFEDGGRSDGGWRESDKRGSLSDDDLSARVATFTTTQLHQYMGLAEDARPKWIEKNGPYSAAAIDAMRSYERSGYRLAMADLIAQRLIEAGSGREVGVQPAPSQAHEIPPAAKPAGFSRRLGARLLDAAILTAIDAALVVVSLRVGGSRAFLFGLLVWQFVGLITLLIYFAVCEGHGGQTLGKRALGIKVVREGGKDLGYANAFVRQLAYIVVAIPCCLGQLATLWDREGRAWHDRMTATRVVKIVGPAGRSLVGPLVIYVAVSAVGLVVLPVMLAPRLDMFSGRASNVPDAGGYFSSPTPDPITAVIDRTNPAATLKWEGADGYKYSAKLFLGSPQAYQPELTLPRHDPNNPLRAGTACTLSPGRDAVVPAVFDMTNETKGFASDVSADLGFVQQAAGTDPIHAIWELVAGPDTGPWAELGFRDGTTCGNAPGSTTSMSITATQLAEGASATLPFFVELKDFYSPSNPKGNIDRLSRIGMTIHGVTQPSTQSPNRYYPAELTGPNVVWVQRTVGIRIGPPR